MAKVNLGASVNQLLGNSTLGDISRALGDNLYGINAKSKNAPLPRVNNSQGYTFFTKPQLRLADENVSNVPSFHSMLTAEKISYQRYTRLTLDPRLHYLVGNQLSSPLVDPYQAFIPILTNTITSLSGWPQLRPPQYTSPTGLYGSQFSHTDGAPNFYEVFDMSATFRTVRGNFHNYLFTAWVLYQSLVFEGLMVPYADMIVNREIDYQTRIYRIVTDYTNRYVTDIACTGAAFPISVPVGDIFDFNIDSTLNNSNKDITIDFRSIGFLFNEDIIKLEFNQVQAIFNPNIAKILKHDFTSNDDDLIRREDPKSIHYIEGCDLVKVPYAALSVIRDDLYNNIHYGLNYNLYPYINLATNELEWWVHKRLLGITK